jgi:hypothetical protein
VGAENGERLGEGSGFPENVTLDVASGVSVTMSATTAVFVTLDPASAVSVTISRGRCAISPASRRRGRS